MVYLAFRTLENDKHLFKEHCCVTIFRLYVVTIFLERPADVFGGHWCAGGERCFTSQLQSRNRTAERRLRLLLRDPSVKGLCSCIKCVEDCILSMN